MAVERRRLTRPDAPWLERPRGFSSRYWSLVTRFFPDAPDTDLLRAMLAAQSVATPAWRRWLDHAGNPVTALGSDPRNIKVLVPLLARHLNELGIAVTPAWQTYARASHLTETLRMTGFLRHAARVMERLNALRIPFVVLKGAALAEHVYKDPALRHAHDFDVLVADTDINAATTTLMDAGFSELLEVGEEFHHTPPLTNAAGFTVELHRRFRVQYPEFSSDGIHDRSRQALVGGREARIPSPEDLLLHACVHAVSCTASRNLRWVADVWTIGKTLTPLDWTRARSLAIESGVALPVMLALGYVTGAIGTLAPDGYVEEMAVAAADTSKVGRSAGAYNARLSLPLGLRGILRLRGDWMARLGQLSWRLLPSPRHLQWMHGLPSTWAAIPQYPVRLVRLVRRVRQVPGTN